MSQEVQSAYIIAAVRTPIGKAPRGIFKQVRPDDLLAHVLKGCMEKVPQIEADRIDDVLVGCAMPEAEQGMNVARISALLAGLPNTVPAATINRFCSSGLQTIAMAAERIGIGAADIVLAGGVESMSAVPLGGYNMSANPDYFTNNEHLGIAYGMGVTAEKVAQQWEISREQQDEFALDSHRKALLAIESGEFNDEILAYELAQSKPNLVSGEIESFKLSVEHDEGPRAGSTLEQLSRLPSVFAAKGSVTAANSSQMSDGAAALLVVSEKVVRELKLKPLAKFLGFAVAGVAPEIMGIGPVKAIPKVLQQAGLALNDIDWIELNEAFAAQSLAVIKDLNLQPEKVNPLGGAIALGHPLGATGAVRSATAIHALNRKQLKYAMVTMCIGTGMGAAGVFAAVED